tara:strand:+ start:273 stop:512 length:240 start_codon:yes stop_codon:yes gene_type:complete
LVVSEVNNNKTERENNMNIDLGNVRKIEKSTKIFDTFTCITLVITNDEGNEVQINIMDNDKDAQIIQIDNGIRIVEPRS